MRNINLFLCHWEREFIKNSFPTQNIKTTSDQSPCPCNLSEKKKRYATPSYKNIGSFFQIWIWQYKPEIFIHSTNEKEMARDDSMTNSWWQDALFRDQHVPSHPWVSPPVFFQKKKNRCKWEKICCCFSGFRSDF